MEKYTIDKQNQKTIIFGKFCNEVFELYHNKFGLESANSLLENAKEIYKTSIEMAEEKFKNNILLVGKVQSGKTANLEMLCSVFFDNGYNIVIIYGGYDNTLLQQTNERFSSTFGILSEPSLENDRPILFTTTNRERKAQIENLDNMLIQEIIESCKPIFITTLKRPQALVSINKIIKKISNRKIKAIIIDDEGDQASLNTKKDKENEFSPTYEKISQMKVLLNYPPYISVTATPQANLFLEDFSNLKPEKLIPIYPASGYCGASIFHSGDRNIIEIVPDSENDIIDLGRMPKIMKQSINHYLIASAIMIKRGNVYSDMIIHSFREVKIHDKIYQLLDSYIDSLKNLTVVDEKIVLNELRIDFVKLFSDTIVQQYKFDDLTKTIMDVVNKTFIIIKNGNNKSNSENLKLKKHKIFIGGDLLQRGVTFDKLCTVYFTRWSESGNMDTSLQRARWFGYRKDYIDLCKIFVTKTIKEELSNLGDMEEDLWEQLEDIYNGVKKIDDIKIMADNTTLIPTRKSVVSFKKIEYKNRWIKQRYGIFNADTKYNYDEINKFIRKLNLEPLYSGRTNRDGEKTADYSYVNSIVMLNLFKHLHGITDSNPLTIKELTYILDKEENVSFIIMPHKENGRERSFDNENRINNIHQGADTSDLLLQKYQGDTKVIVDRTVVNIQLHLILPKKEGIIQTSYLQYMFAIYSPNVITYYSRDEK